MAAQGNAKNALSRNHQRTAQGNGKNARYTNKHKRRQRGKHGYRGQGR